MNDHIALHDPIRTTRRKSLRLKRGVCALAATMTLGSIAGGTVLAATSASSALAGKGGTTVSPLGNSWR